MSETLRSGVDQDPTPALETTSESSPSLPPLSAGDFMRQFSQAATSMINKTSYQIPVRVVVNEGCTLDEGDIADVTNVELKFLPGGGEIMAIYVGTIEENGYGDDYDDDALDNIADAVKEGLEADQQDEEVDEANDDDVKPLGEFEPEVEKA